MAKIRVCETVVRPRVVEFISTTRPDKTHAAVPGTLWNDSFCTCEGWQFSGKRGTEPTCKHVKQLEEYRCHWFERLTDKSAQIMECPKCEGPVVTFDMAPEFDG